MARILSQTALGQNLNPEIFDHRVGEQFLCRILQRRLGAGAIGALELDVKHLALAHAGDAVDTERLEGPLDRLPWGSRMPDFNVTVMRAFMA